MTATLPAFRPRSLETRAGGPPRVGVFGASGAAGLELVRLLTHHPSVRLAFGTSRGEAGRPLDELDASAPALRLAHPDEVDLGSIDIAMLGVPHGTAGPLAERCLEAGARVIDLSGDHRLKSPERHRAVYGSDRSEEVARRAVYGLPEVARAEIREARLVANPGCYPTCVGLALAPLSSAGALDGVVVVDAKSGVSGAGRSPSLATHFCSAVDDVRPYKLGRAHRHVAEMEQLLDGLRPQAAPREGLRLVFNPHVVPLERGMLATIVVPSQALTAREVRAVLAARYRREPFVRVLPEGRVATIRAAARTNRAVLSVHGAPEAGVTVVTSAIDNLLKGAAGQAVQNLNLLLGLPEEEGLR